MDEPPPDQQADPTANAEPNLVSEDVPQPPHPIPDQGQQTSATAEDFPQHPPSVCEEVQQPVPAMPPDIGPPVPQLNAQMHSDTYQAADDMPQMDMHMPSNMPQMGVPMLQMDAPMPQLDTPMSDNIPQMDAPMHDSMPQIDTGFHDNRPQMDAPIRDSMPQIDTGFHDNRPQMDASIRDSRPPMDAPIRDSRPQMDAPMYDSRPQMGKPIHDHVPQMDAPIHDIPQMAASVHDVMPQMDAPIHANMPQIDKYVHDVMPLRDVPIPQLDPSLTDNMPQIDTGLHESEHFPENISEPNFAEAAEMHRSDIPPTDDEPPLNPRNDHFDEAPPESEEFEQMPEQEEDDDYSARSVSVPVTTVNSSHVLIGQGFGIGVPPQEYSGIAMSDGSMLMVPNGKKKKKKKKKKKGLLDEMSEISGQPVMIENFSDNKEGMSPIPQLPPHIQPSGEKEQAQRDMDQFPGPHGPPDQMGNQQRPPHMGPGPMFGNLQGPPKPLMGEDFDYGPGFNNRGSGGFRGRGRGGFGGEFEGPPEEFDEGNRGNRRGRGGRGRPFPRHGKYKYPDDFDEEDFEEYDNSYSGNQGQWGYDQNNFGPRGGFGPGNFGPRGPHNFNQRPPGPNNWGQGGPPPGQWGPGHYDNYNQGPGDFHQGPGDFHQRPGDFHQGPGPQGFPPPPPGFPPPMQEGFHGEGFPAGPPPPPQRDASFTGEVFHPDGFDPNAPVPNFPGGPAPFLPGQPPPEPVNPLPSTEIAQNLIAQGMNPSLAKILNDGVEIPENLDSSPEKGKRKKKKKGQAATEPEAFELYAEAPLPPPPFIPLPPPEPPSHEKKKKKKRKRDRLEGIIMPPEIPLPPPPQEPRFEGPQLPPGHPPMPPEPTVSAPNEPEPPPLPSETAEETHIYNPEDQQFEQEFSGVPSPPLFQEAEERAVLMEPEQQPPQPPLPFNAQEPTIDVQQPAWQQFIPPDARDMNAEPKQAHQGSSMLRPLYLIQAQQQKQSSGEVPGQMETPSVLYQPVNAPETNAASFGSLAATIEGVQAPVKPSGRRSRFDPDWQPQVKHHPLPVPPISQTGVASQIPPPLVITDIPGVMAQPLIAEQPVVQEMMAAEEPTIPSDVSSLEGYQSINEMVPEGYDQFNEMVPERYDQFESMVAQSVQDPTNVEEPIEMEEKNVMAQENEAVTEMDQSPSVEINKMEEYLNTDDDTELKEGDEGYVYYGNIVDKKEEKKEILPPKEQITASQLLEKFKMRQKEQKTDVSRSTAMYPAVIPAPISQPIFPPKIPVPVLPKEEKTPGKFTFAIRKLKQLEAEKEEEEKQAMIVNIAGNEKKEDGSGDAKNAGKLKNDVKDERSRDEESVKARHEEKEKNKKEKSESRRHRSRSDERDHKRQSRSRSAERRKKRKSKSLSIDRDKKHKSRSRSHDRDRKRRSRSDDRSRRPRSSSRSYERDRHRKSRSRSYGRDRFRSDSYRRSDDRYGSRSRHDRDERHSRKSRRSRDRSSDREKSERRRDERSYDRDRSSRETEKGSKDKNRGRDKERTSKSKSKSLDRDSRNRDKRSASASIEKSESKDINNDVDKENKDSTDVRKQKIKRESADRTTSALSVKQEVNEDQNTKGFDEVFGIGAPTAKENVQEQQIPGTALTDMNMEVELPSEIAKPNFDNNASTDTKIRVENDNVDNVRDDRKKEKALKTDNSNTIDIVQEKQKEMSEMECVDSKLHKKEKPVGSSDSEMDESNESGRRVKSKRFKDQIEHEKSSKADGKRDRSPEYDDKRKSERYDRNKDDKYSNERERNRKNLGHNESYSRNTGYGSKYPDPGNTDSDNERVPRSKKKDSRKKYENDNSSEHEKSPVSKRKGRMTKRDTSMSESKDDYMDQRNIKAVTRSKWDSSASESEFSVRKYPAGSLDRMQRYSEMTNLSRERPRRIDERSPNINQDRRRKVVEDSDDDDYKAKKDKSKHLIEGKKKGTDKAKKKSRHAAASESEDDEDEYSKKSQKKEKSRKKKNKKEKKKQADSDSEVEHYQNDKKKKKTKKKKNVVDDDISGDGEKTKNSKKERKLEKKRRQTRSESVDNGSEMDVSEVESVKKRNKVKEYQMSDSDHHAKKKDTKQKDKGRKPKYDSDDDQYSRNRQSRRSEKEKVEKKRYDSENESTNRSKKHKSKDKKGKQYQSDESDDYSMDRKDEKKKYADKSRRNYESSISDEEEIDNHHKRRPKKVKSKEDSDESDDDKYYKRRLMKTKGRDKAAVSDSEDEQKSIKGKKKDKRKRYGSRSGSVDSDESRSRKKYKKERERMSEEVESRKRGRKKRVDDSESDSNIYRKEKYRRKGRSASLETDPSRRRSKEIAKHSRRDETYDSRSRSRERDKFKKRDRKQKSQSPTPARSKSKKKRETSVDSKSLKSRKTKRYSSSENSSGDEEEMHISRKKNIAVPEHKQHSKTKGKSNVDSSSEDSDFDRRRKHKADSETAARSISKESMSDKYREEKALMEKIERRKHEYAELERKTSENVKKGRVEPMQLDTNLKQRRHKQNDSSDENSSSPERKQKQLDMDEQHRRQLSSERRHKQQDLSEGEVVTPEPRQIRRDRSTSIESKHTRSDISLERDMSERKQHRDISDEVMSKEYDRRKTKDLVHYKEREYSRDSRDIRKKDRKHSNDDRSSSSSSSSSSSDSSSSSSGSDDDDMKKKRGRKKSFSDSEDEYYKKNKGSKNVQAGAGSQVGLVPGSTESKEKLDMPSPTIASSKIKDENLAVTLHDDIDGDSKSREHEADDREADTADMQITESMVIIPKASRPEDDDIWSDSSNGTPAPTGLRLLMSTYDNDGYDSGDMRKLDNMTLKKDVSEDNRLVSNEVVEKPILKKPPVLTKLQNEDSETDFNKSNSNVLTVESIDNLKKDTVAEIEGKTLKLVSRFEEQPVSESMETVSIPVTLNDEASLSEHQDMTKEKTTVQISAKPATGELYDPFELDASDESDVTTQKSPRGPVITEELKLPEPLIAKTSSDTRGNGTQLEGHSLESSSMTVLNEYGTPVVPEIAACSSAAFTLPEPGLHTWVYVKPSLPLVTTELVPPICTSAVEVPTPLPIQVQPASVDVQPPVAISQLVPGVAGLLPPLFPVHIPVPTPSSTPVFPVQTAMPAAIAIPAPVGVTNLPICLPLLLPSNLEPPQTGITIDNTRNVESEIVSSAGSSSIPLPDHTHTDAVQPDFAEDLYDPFAPDAYESPPVSPVTAEESAIHSATADPGKVVVKFSLSTGRKNFSKTAVGLDEDEKPANVSAPVRRKSRFSDKADPEIAMSQPGVVQTDTGHQILLEQLPIGHVALPQINSELAMSLEPNVNTVADTSRFRRRSRFSDKADPQVAASRPGVAAIIKTDNTPQILSEPVSTEVAVFSKTTMSLNEQDVKHASKSKRKSRFSDHPNPPVTSMHKGDALQDSNVSEKPLDTDRKQRNENDSALIGSDNKNNEKKHETEAKVNTVPEKDLELKDTSRRKDGKSDSHRTRKEHVEDASDSKQRKSIDRRSFEKDVKEQASGSTRKEDLEDSSEMKMYDCKEHKETDELARKDSRNKSFERDKEKSIDKLPESGEKETHKSDKECKKLYERDNHQTTAREDSHKRDEKESRHRNKRYDIDRKERTREASTDRADKEPHELERKDKKYEKDKRVRTREDADEREVQETEELDRKSRNKKSHDKESKRRIREDTNVRDEEDTKKEKERKGRSKIHEKDKKQRDREDSHERIEKETHKLETKGRDSSYEKERKERAREDSSENDKKDMGDRKDEKHQSEKLHDFEDRKERQKMSKHIDDDRVPHRHSSESSKQYSEPKSFLLEAGGRKIDRNEEQETEETIPSSSASLGKSKKYDKIESNSEKSIDGTKADRSGKSVVRTRLASIDMFMDIDDEVSIKMPEDIKEQHAHHNIHQPKAKSEEREQPITATVKAKSEERAVSKTLSPTSPSKVKDRSDVFSLEKEFVNQIPESNTFESKTPNVLDASSLSTSSEQTWQLTPRGLYKFSPKKAAFGPAKEITNIADLKLKDSSRKQYLLMSDAISSDTTQEIKSESQTCVPDAKDDELNESRTSLATPDPVVADTIQTLVTDTIQTLAAHDSVVSEDSLQKRKEVPKELNDEVHVEETSGKKHMQGKKSKDPVVVPKRLTRRLAAEHHVVLPPVMSKDMPTRGRKGRKSVDQNDMALDQTVGSTPTVAETDNKNYDILASEDESNSQTSVTSCSSSSDSQTVCFVSESSINDKPDRDPVSGSAVQQLERETELPNISECQQPKGSVCDSDVLPLKSFASKESTDLSNEDLHAKEFKAGSELEHSTSRKESSVAANIPKAGLELLSLGSSTTVELTGAEMDKSISEPKSNLQPTKREPKFKSEHTKTISKTESGHQVERKIAGHAPEDIHPSTSADDVAASVPHETYSTINVMEITASLEDKDIKAEAGVSNEIVSVPNISQLQMSVEEAKLTEHVEDVALNSSVSTEADAEKGEKGVQHESPKRLLSKIAEHISALEKSNQSMKEVLKSPEKQKEQHASDVDAKQLIDKSLKVETIYSKATYSQETREVVKKVYDMPMEGVPHDAGVKLENVSTVEAGTGESTDRKHSKTHGLRISNQKLHDAEVSNIPVPPAIPTRSSEARHIPMKELQDMKKKEQIDISTSGQFGKKKISIKLSDRVQPLPFSLPEFSSAVKQIIPISNAVPLVPDSTSQESTKMISPLVSQSAETGSPIQVIGQDTLRKIEVIGQTISKVIEQGNRIQKLKNPASHPVSGARQIPVLGISSRVSATTSVGGGVDTQALISAQCKDDVELGVLESHKQHILQMLQYGESSTRGDINANKQLDVQPPLPPKEEKGHRSDEHANDGHFDGQGDEHDYDKDRRDYDHRDRREYDNHDEKRSRDRDRYDDRKDRESGRERRESRDDDYNKSRSQSERSRSDRSREGDSRRRERQRSRDRSRDRSRERRHKRKKEDRHRDRDYESRHRRRISRSRSRSRDRRSRSRDTRRNRSRDRRSRSRDRRSRSQDRRSRSRDRDRRSRSPDRKSRSRSRERYRGRRSRSRSRDRSREREDKQREKEEPRRKDSEKRGDKPKASALEKFEKELAEKKKIIQPAAASPPVSGPICPGAVTSQEQVVNTQAPDFTGQLAVDPNAQFLPSHFPRQPPMPPFMPPQEAMPPQTPPGLPPGPPPGFCQYPIDPNTGYAIDPNTGMPVDPGNGMSLQINPNTGMPYLPPLVGPSGPPPGPPMGMPPPPGMALPPGPFPQGPMPPGPPPPGFPGPPGPPFPPNMELPFPGPPMEPSAMGPPPPVSMPGFPGPPPPPSPFNPDPMALVGHVPHDPNMPPAPQFYGEQNVPEFHVAPQEPGDFGESDHQMAGGQFNVIEPGTYFPEENYGERKEMFQKPKLKIKRQYSNEDTVKSTYEIPQQLREDKILQPLLREDKQSRPSRFSPRVESKSPTWKPSTPPISPAIKTEQAPVPVALTPMKEPDDVSPVIPATTAKYEETVMKLDDVKPADESETKTGEERESGSVIKEDDTLITTVEEMKDQDLVKSEVQQVLEKSETQQTSDMEMSEVSDSDNATGVPMKVKSRWLQASEAEKPTPDSDGKALETLPAATEVIEQEKLETEPVKPPEPDDKDVQPTEDTVDVKKEGESNEAGKEAEKDDEIPINFDLIEENIYLFERKRSKQMREVRRMVCDCTTSKEDGEMGHMACGEDCLNRMLFIECGSKCPCGDYCTNKKFYKKQNSKVAPFKTDWKGHGLQALEDLEPGQFVMEYVGEVLDNRMFRSRAKQYSRAGQQHFYFMAINPDEVIDATIKGNVSRFINHSCDPNCETQKWTVNGILRVGFFVRKPMTTGEELTFDYQYEIYGQEAQKCFCGTEACRGFIGGPKSHKKAEVNEEEEMVETIDTFEETDKLEEEIERMSELEQGLRNKVDVLNICRLMVRAEDPEHRKQILKILENTTESGCLRLFLDYHGLPLLWSWMADVKQISDELKTLTLELLEQLPITNKTILVDSKILAIVERWSVPTVPTETGEINEPASETTEDEGESIPPPPPVISNKTPVSILSNIRDVKTVKKHVKFADENSSSDSESRTSTSELDTSENADVDAAAVLKAKNKRESMELRRKVLDKKEGIKFHEAGGDIDADDEGQGEDLDTTLEAESGLEDTTLEGGLEGNGEKAEMVAGDKVSTLASKLLEGWADLKEIYKIPKKEVLEERKRNERELDAASKKTEKTKPSAWDLGWGRKRKRESSYNKEDTDDSDSASNRKALLSTPPKLSKSERRQKFEANVKAQEEMNAEKLREQERQQEEQVAQEALIQQQHQQQLMQDPNFLLYAIQDPNFLPSIGIDTAQFIQQVAMDHLLLQHFIAINPNFPQQLEHLTLLYQTAALQAAEQFAQSVGMGDAFTSGTENQPSGATDDDGEPVSEQHLAFLQQVELFKQKHLEPNETAPTSTTEEDVPPPPSPPKGKPIVLPPNWKTANDAEGKMYYYHTVTRQTQWDPPTLDQGEHDEMDIGSLGTPSMEDIITKYVLAEPIMSSKRKTTTAAADTSSDSKKLKEAFKSKMSSWIVVCLNPFRKNDCQEGRITSTDDFKHLARKLTHHVMAKELKHCKHVEDLEVNENVKSKAKDFVRKYMVKYGVVYKRSGNSPNYD